MTRPELLFYGPPLDAVLRGSEQKMGEAAAAIAAEHALDRTVDQLATELIEKFHIAPLVCDWGAMTVSSKDTKIEVSGDWNRAIFDRGQPLYIDGTEVTCHIPFTGERDLFKFQPSTFTFNPPRGTVGQDELRLVASAPADGREGLKGALDSQVTKVKEYLTYANADVAAFNARLDTSARAAVEGRRAKVLADRELVAGLGIPLKNRDQATPTYVVAPARGESPRASPGRAASRPEPTLQADAYEHILAIARGMSMVMERSPKSFASVDEEALRHHFLVQLNGHYPGRATGETFNFAGKTDILLRDGDRNVFIAECKFWGGPAKLKEAVDQLLGYASWRDTKTAIFLFNRGRALTSVLSKISPTISSHANFVRKIPTDDETEFRFVLRHRDDLERELTLSVLVFEVPGN